MFQPSKWRARAALALTFCSLAAHAETVTGSYFGVSFIGPGSGDKKFAISVAMADGEIILNAPKADEDPTGFASVFRRNGRDWELETSLTHIQPASDFGAYLGCNPVAIEGDVVIIGEPSANSGQGDVLVYRRTAKGWILETTLRDTAGAVHDSFGCGIGISHGVVVVGAPGKSTTGQGYVFTNTGSTWSLAAHLVPTGAAAKDNVGFSAAIDGAEIVLGAPHAASNKGAAYVFKKSGALWSQAKVLSASDGAVEDQFGAAVALSRGVVLVGAPEQAAGKGAAYFFGGASLSQLQEVNAIGNFNLGASVALDGNRAAISQLHDDSVDFYFNKGSAWSKVASAKNTMGTRFGGSVAMFGGDAFIGAYADGGGKAYEVRDERIFSDGFQ